MSYAGHIALKQAAYLRLIFKKRVAGAPVPVMQKQGGQSLWKSTAEGKKEKKTPAGNHSRRHFNAAGTCSFFQLEDVVFCFFFHKVAVIVLPFNQK